MIYESISDSYSTKENNKNKTFEKFSTAIGTCSCVKCPEFAISDRMVLVIRDTKTQPELLKNKFCIGKLYFLKQ